MRFGMPVLVECEDLRSCARLCAQLGLDFIELNLCFPLYQPEVLTADLLSSLREEYGVDYTFHTDDQFNPFDINRRVAEANTQTMLELISLCRKLNLSRINMHLLRGIYVTLPEKKVFINDIYREDYLRKVKEFGRRCQQAAGDHPMKICIENMESGFLPANLEAISLLLESPLFGLTLDTGHEFVARGADLALYQTREDKLCHMHLHDALLPSSPHLPLGEGQMDLAKKIEQARRTQSSCVLEVKTIDGLKKSVRYLKENGYL